MYAIVEINGQQFKAEAGQKLFVHHIQNVENGATVEFEKVLLVEKEGAITVGGHIIIWLYHTLIIITKIIQLMLITL